MALITSNNPSVTFSIKSERECNMIFDILLRREIYGIGASFPIMDPSIKSYEARKNMINESLMLWNVDDNNKKLYISKVLSLCAEALLPESKFKWINKDNELLYKWVHAEIAYKERFNLYYRRDTFEEYYDDIVGYVDKLQNRNEKESLLFNLQSSWLNFFKLGEKFKWIDQGNESLVKWAWDYCHSKNIPLNFIPVAKETERYVSLIIMFNHWDAHPDTKSLFLVHIKKALNQKKQRDKRDGKKAYNIVMSEDIKGKLNTLAEHHDRKINQTLERLIKQEYDRVFKT